MGHKMRPSEFRVASYDLLTSKLVYNQFYLMKKIVEVLDIESLHKTFKTCDHKLT